MSGVAPKPPRPNYGIDAPGVIRNLFVGGAIGLFVWATAAVGLWSGAVVGIPLAATGLACAVAFSAMASGMLWYSKIGKVRTRERLLDLVVWAGDEAVLDIGCGRGLMLIGAAKRLRNGRAIGIDLWQAEDLSGNRPEATLENARREGVADRVEVQTADMRQIPFPNNSFDVVVSCAAIHNLYTAPDRQQAIREIARVLKPAGKAVIADIRHLSEYAETFANHGCPDTQRVSSRWKTLLLAAFTFGALQPAVVLARKGE